MPVNVQRTGHQGLLRALVIGVPTAILTAVVLLTLPDISGSSSPNPRELRGIGGRARHEQGAENEPRYVAALVRRLVSVDPDEAISLIEQTLHETENDELYSDLAAARIERSLLRDRPDDLPAALEAAERALALDTGSPAARFNRALALELLHLGETARVAWDQYLELDPTSIWAIRARKRRDRLSAPPRFTSWDQVQSGVLAAARRQDVGALVNSVAAHPAHVRAHVENVALADWAEHWLVGDRSRAAEELTIARVLSRALFEQTGERLPLDAVGAIDEALDAADADRQRIDRLATAQQAYLEGLDAMAGFDCARAKPQLDVAGATFREAGSAMAFRVTHRLATCHYHGRRWPEMVEALESMRDTATERGYLDVLGRIDWLEGLWQFKRADLSLALRHYRASLEVFQRSGDRSSELFLRTMIAETLHTLGDTQREWRQRRTVLEGLERMNASRRAVTLSEFARATFDADQPVVALHFLDRALRLARQELRIEDVIETLKDRSLILAALGSHTEAEADLDEAEAALGGAADEQFRSNLQRDIWAARGRVRRAEDPAGAIVLLTKAFEAYSEEQTESPLEALLLERGRARLATGDADGAAADFRSALGTLERHREGIDLPSHRVSFFDRSRLAADELVALELDRGRIAEALDASEWGRARQLLEQRAAGPESAPAVPLRPLPAELLQQHISPETAILVYDVLPDQLIVWSIREQSIRVNRVEIEAATIGASVNELVDGLASVARGDETAAARERQSRQAAARLFDWLIRKNLPELVGVQQLFVVPDKSLHRIPFAALLDSSRRRWLIEDYEVIVAPSATLAVSRAAPSTDEAAVSMPSALVIGDPQLDPETLALPALPGARREAGTVAELYPRHRILTGAEATKARFLELAARHGVVHFSGHALTNADSPEHSRLLLAADPSGEDSGSLFAFEIRDIVFDETEVIVLAACATASGAISDGEGPLSLARSFLAGGAIGVVATMWPIDDDGSVELFRALHEQLARGIRPSAALRAAQLRLLDRTTSEGRSPAIWAAAQVYGAGRGRR